MQLIISISKTHARILSALLFILIVGISADYASSTGGLAQWHPLSEISADGGATSIDTKINITSSGNITLMGNVGIGTNNPQAKLDVAGKIKIGNDAVAPTAGTIRWTGTSFEGYNGTAWVSFAGSGGGSGGDGAPLGTIAMWAGTLATIPSGWQLCDGTGGMPDLRAKFVRGVLTGQNPGATGGDDLHTLTIDEMPAHNHNSLAAASGVYITYTTTSPGYIAPSAGNTGSTGGGQPFDNRPAYYEVAFICKVSAGGGTGIWTETVSSIYTTNTGKNVGIGTASPMSKLQVAGGVQVGNDTATCDASKGGTMRWTGTALDMCDESSWVTLLTKSGLCGNTPQTPLTDACSGTWSGQGAYFNIKANVPVNIKQFALMSQHAGSRTTAVYYREGSYAGYVGDSAAWKLLGFGPYSPSSAVSCPVPYTNIPVTFSVCIPAGQTYGFYIVMTDGTGSYEADSGSAEGSVVASNADMDIVHGKMQQGDGAFGGTISNANGIQMKVYYEK